MEAMESLWLGCSFNDQGISGKSWAWAGVRSHPLTQQRVSLFGACNS
jgi:hypothetical protein